MALEANLLNSYRVPVCRELKISRRRRAGSEAAPGGIAGDPHKLQKCRRDDPQVPRAYRRKRERIGQVVVLHRAAAKLKGLEVAYAVASRVAAGSAERVTRRQAVHIRPPVGQSVMV